MARSGTSAWLPKRPEELPGSGSARLGRARGDLSRTPGRITRPFRFGSEEGGDPDPPLAAGSLIGGRYRIVTLLGEGGMGRVYEAEHTVLRRHVALKLLRRDVAEVEENLARFRREALAASRIGAPEIVEVVDFDSHEGEGGRQTYMVMELLVGESLEQWMERPGSLAEAFELLAGLCDGLAAAHRAGVIHRDIKPANVFCRARCPELAASANECRVKILDFGIAKMTEGGAGFQTQRGALLGTPYYLAPERVRGAELSAAADIYSIGVILYELLTGNVPFVADSFMGILARHVHDQPLDPRQAAPERPLPDAVASLALRLLAKDPAQRPSALALASELRELGPGLATLRTGPRAQREMSLPADEALAERETLAPSLAPSLARQETVPPGDSGAGQGADSSGMSASEPMRFARSGPAQPEEKVAVPAVASTPKGEREAVKSGRRGGLVMGAIFGAVVVGGIVFVSTGPGDEAPDADADADAAWELSGQDSSALERSPERMGEAVEASSPPQEAAPPPAQAAAAASPADSDPQDARESASSGLRDVRGAPAGQSQTKSERKKAGRGSQIGKNGQHGESQPSAPTQPEQPEQPEPEPAEPAAPADVDPAPDSQLPTIKDDVYD